MKLRGRRECVDCGERWSYFERDSVDCPRCGSLRSTAVEEEGTLHTAGGNALDLSEARQAVDTAPLGTVARLAAEASREFLADRGFIDRGELRSLDEITVAVAELRQVANRLRRSIEPEEDAEWYLLALLRGAEDGERPEEVPQGFEAVRGLAIAAAVERYRVDMVRYLEADPDPEARRALGTLRDHLRRVEALDGDVPVEHSERLLAAVRELGAYLQGDEGALARAEDRLARL
ncbi:MAG: TFIIB-type zinc ribbon-containing protein [Halobacteriales archaeon]